MIRVTKPVVALSGQWIRDQVLNHVTKLGVALHVCQLNGVHVMKLDFALYDCRQIRHQFLNHVTKPEADYPQLQSQLLAPAIMFDLALSDCRWIQDRL